MDLANLRPHPQRATENLHQPLGRQHRRATFLGGLPDGGQELRLRTTEGTAVADVKVRLPANAEPVGFTLAVEEALRDEGDDDHRARTRYVDEVRSALARTALPDEVVPLREVLTDLEGGPAGTLTLLSLERWDRLVRLHHHWAPTDARDYSRSPLRSRFDVLDSSGRPVAGALAGGGSSTHGGCSYTLDLAIGTIPAELRLRRRYSAA